LAKVFILFLLGLIDGSGISDGYGGNHYPKKSSMASRYRGRAKRKAARNGEACAGKRVSSHAPDWGLPSPRKGLCGVSKITLNNGGVPLRRSRVSYPVTYPPMGPEDVSGPNIEEHVSISALRRSVLLRE
jgi:hypothetical protein